MDDFGAGQQGGRVRVGREYLRVSYDRSGRERSQDEQHDDNGRAAVQAGVRLAEPYREAGSASASRFATKVRGDFARLLADLGSGRFGADVLVLWESSRGSRKVGEWVTLIELCEQAGVSIFVTTHGREYQPGNARDRRSLLEDAVDSEYESSKVSARARRAAAANARAGRPHGRAPFGYVRRYDERTRVMIAQEPDPATAPIVAELFARIIAGHSLKGIARDFEAAGYVNASGRPFTAAHLRTIAINPTYAAIRVHTEQPRGDYAAQRGVKSATRALHAALALTATPGSPATPGSSHDGPGGGGPGSGGPVVDRDGFSEVTVRGRRVRGMQDEGAWPALVSRADFLAVQSILADPKRVTTRPGRARHLLSMIARCHECGGELTVTTRVHADGEYQCRKGHVRVRKDELDEVATTAILTYLSRPDVHAALDDGDTQRGGELDRLRERLAAARAELETLRVEVGAGRLSVASLVAAEPAILARITTLEARENDLATPSTLRGLITTGTDVADRWQAAPVATRRAIAKLLLTPEHLGELHARRRPPEVRNIRVHAAERITWITRPD